MPSSERSQTLPISLALQIYSLIVLCLFAVLKFIGLFNQAISRQLEHRFDMLQQNAVGSPKKDHIFFFCSSAGEYEQAKPLIERWVETGRLNPVTIFFSRSGYDYAHKKNEASLYFMAPPDCVWFWELIFRQFRPKATVIVRHEFWPAFVAVSRKFSFLAAIDVNTAGSSAPWTSSKHALTRKMLSMCDDISTVTELDAETIRNFAPSFNANNCRAVGDTKFDRVLQRQKSSEEELIKIDRTVSAHLKPGRRLVVGSGWPPDIEIALNCFQRDQKDWVVIIAPHDIGQPMLSLVENMCKSRNLRFRMFTDEPIPNDPCTVLIINTMGNLAEIYGCSSAALIGGALTHQVHNVLEPACYGIPIAFGPRYLNSGEAKLLARRGLATVIQSSEELAVWQQNSTAQSPAAMRAFIAQMTGASDRVYSFLSDKTT